MERQYRYETLIAISAPLEPELVLTNALTKASPKTYQVWHHRQLLLTALRDPTPELAFNEELLKADSKNYHTWSHRQWLLAHFDQAELWSGELQFVERLLTEDVRNNSAWHHRFFVSFENGSKVGTGGDADEAVRRELAYVFLFLSRSAYWRSQLPCLPNGDVLGPWPVHLKLRQGKDRACAE